MQPLLQFYADSFDTLQVLGHGLKMDTLFGYNPQIIFVTFLTKLTLSFFWPK